MSDPHMHDPIHEKESFEREDIGARTIFRFLAGIAILLIVMYAVVMGIYGYLDHYQLAHEPVQNPLVPTAGEDTRTVNEEQIKSFPQPRLEKNERLEINNFRVKEEQALNSYGWVDEKTGVVHIPIARAMELVAQRGWPTRPQDDAAASGTAPGHPINDKKDSKTKAVGQ